MRTGTWLISLLILLFATATFAAEKIVLLEIDGAIGPATQDYIKRGIDQAAQEKARAVIIQLNTPGGLESAMRGKIGRAARRESVWQKGNISGGIGSIKQK